MKKKIILYTEIETMQFNTAVLEVDGRAHATADVRQIGSRDSIDVHTSKSTDILNDVANVHVIETAEDLLNAGLLVKHELELDSVQYTGIITQTTFRGEQLKEIKF